MLFPKTGHPMVERLTHLSLFIVCLTILPPRLFSVSSEPAPLQLFLEKMIENQKQNRLLEMSYTYEMKKQTQVLDRGQPTETKRETFEVIPLEDGDYKRRIEKDGKVLSESERQKEQAKLEEEFKKRAGLSETEKAKLEKKRNERRQKEEKLWTEVLRAFDFRQAGQEEHQGRITRIIDFYPRAGYEPPKEYGDFRLLKKVKGRIWVDEVDFQICRGNVEFIEDFKLGAGLVVKINQGATYSVLQSKINDEVWLPAHDEITAQGRLFLFKGFGLKIVNDYSGYRRFETEVNLRPTEGGP
jgi:hypothetical protein